jgi:hypothetical protein
LIAFQAPPEFLVGVLPELIKDCDEDENWIVSRAAFRSHQAKKIGSDVLAAIKERSLASYAYVCARTGTPITHDEAMIMIRTTTSSKAGGERNLVVWSIGQLGMWDTLDQIREIASELLEADEVARLAEEAAELRRFGLDVPVMDEEG